jgi:hypothetical protein
MTTYASLDLIPRELAYRENDGLQVSLLWHKTDNSLTVTVVDSLAGEGFDFPVRGEDALDAFDHPYAYAACCGVPYRSRRSVGAIGSELM